METGRVLAREDRHPSRRADRTGCIGVGETHALLGQAIQVRCLMQVVAVARQPRPTKVIGQQQHDIGSLRRMSREGQEVTREDNSCNNFHVRHNLRFQVTGVTEIILQQAQAGQCQ